MKKWLILFMQLLSMTVIAADIDSFVKKRCDSQSISLSGICDDEVFLRRLYLTVTGRIPTSDEAKAFLKNNSSEKRSELIDRLLDSDDYVAYQTLKWGDLLRIKSEFPSNLWPNAVQAYNHWIRTQIRNNVPYDRFVRELLLSSGSNFRFPPVNFYRAFQTRTPDAIAGNVALLFLGYRQMPANTDQFFTQLKYKKTNEWKEEIVYVDTDLYPKRSTIVMPDGKKILFYPETDFRKQYVEWLVSPDNKQFSYTIVNRIWFWLMGYGIVNEPDDFRQENPPSNPELLEFLSSEFVSNKFDLKYIYRLILNSSAFQRSSHSIKGVEDRSYFSSYYPQRLTAEQLTDALCDITGIYDSYMSKVPEPYSYFPSDTRAVEIGDGTVTSSQLDLFGRPSRDVSIESDRDNRLTDKQILYLLNSTVIYDKIDKSPRLRKMIKDVSSDKDLMEDLYLLVLSRYPRSEEQNVLYKYVETHPERQKWVNDVVWALINSREFLFNH